MLYELLKIIFLASCTTVGKEYKGESSHPLKAIFKGEVDKFGIKRLGHTLFSSPGKLMEKCTAGE